MSLAGPALLDAFMKMLARTDGRIAVGWMDGTTHAFIDGATFPLYRLFAATWYQYRRVSPDRFDGATIEVAFYHDIETGAPLESLRMPVTGTVVEVPRYRTGPTATKAVLHLDEERPFGMAPRGRAGGNFFRSGIARSRADITRPERDGAMFLVHESHDTRVIPDDPGAPGFFYREWTIRKAPWDVVMDPQTTGATTEVIYASLAAYRPWMKMEGVPGHTIQSGLGAKIQRVQDLPGRILDLCRKYHPDLVDEPEKAFTPPAP